MTWRDLKVFTLQKMFAITGDELVEDETTNPYLKSMPAVANEALQLLSTAGRFIKKTLTIEQLAEDADPEESTADIKTTAQDGIYRYDLGVLTEDYYSFGTIFLEEDGRYAPAADYVIEGDKTLVLNAATIGKWTLYYNAYPEEITKDTLDDTELSLHPEVAALMPLYMASQIYKDDDIGQAVQFRNEFEVGREALMMNAARQKTGTESFTSASGWW